ncbi:hypothetical protein NCER_100482 [Vairimorpha ceranae BRL01]|uniref:Uncharacterized protein n=2 Tax=Vairimorpha ceranae TaxID=40302 RepID=C4V7P6_VAIC1|nr:hypothetical protein AAJ76_2200033295 [Vairimorpha ceranae]EEQ82764.1 hypothetical protein NCER_100482 [Vairimorpha ceranae BRL01]KAF5140588.1 hypothetical protein G9O61_00g013930 [Vairimorpha ceranae]KKO75409.1 hypothetical protein AAJ76_2200033295 [Vairimorpha ceranae]
MVIFFILSFYAKVLVIDDLNISKSISPVASRNLIKSIKKNVASTNEEVVLLDQNKNPKMSSKDLEKDCQDKMNCNEDKVEIDFPAIEHAQLSKEIERYEKSVNELKDIVNKAKNNKQKNTESDYSPENSRSFNNQNDEQKQESDLFNNNYLKNLYPKKNNFFNTINNIPADSTRQKVKKSSPYDALESFKPDIFPSPKNNPLNNMNDIINSFKKELSNIPNSNLAFKSLQETNPLLNVPSNTIHDPILSTPQDLNSTRPTFFNNQQNPNSKNFPADFSSIFSSNPNQLQNLFPLSNEDPNNLNLISNNNPENISKNFNDTSKPFDNLSDTYPPMPYNFKNTFNNNSSNLSLPNFLQNFSDPGSTPYNNAQSRSSSYDMPSSNNTSPVEQQMENRLAYAKLKEQNNLIKAIDNRKEYIKMKLQEIKANKDKLSLEMKSYKTKVKNILNQIKNIKKGKDALINQINTNKNHIKNLNKNSMQIIDKKEHVISLIRITKNEVQRYRNLLENETNKLEMLEKQYEVYEDTLKKYSDDIDTEAHKLNRSSAELNKNGIDLENLEELYKEYNQKNQQIEEELRRYEKIAMCLDTEEKKVMRNQLSGLFV